MRPASTVVGPNAVHWRVNPDQVPEKWILNPGKHPDQVVQNEKRKGLLFIAGA
jgi:hypothetical protein